MSVTTLSSREFQQNTSRAQAATKGGPVFITKRGQPAQVLLSIDDYEMLTGRRGSIVDALSMPDLGDIDLDVPRSAMSPRSADFS